MRAYCLVIVLTLMGCSSSEFELAPVSGKVTLDGKPLSGAGVVFQPRAQGDSRDAGPTSIGTTDEQGRFSLRVNTDNREGAVIGEHTVLISTSATIDPVDDSVRPSKELVPLKYMDGSLRCTVSAGGTDNANFEL